MAVASIHSNPARVGAHSPDGRETVVGGSIDDARVGAMAAPIAGASSAGGISAEALGGVSLHKDLRGLARPAAIPAKPASGDGPVLYSGKDGAAVGAAMPTTAQADNARRATIQAGRKVLAEALNAAAQEQAAGNKASPHKAQVVELLHAFSVKYPEEMPFMMADISPALSQLLGAYGFKTWDEIGAQGPGSGKLEERRLDYAIENFRRMTDRERMLLEYGVKPASQFGIALALTSGELAAREALDISARLPDGTQFRGTRAEYREASRRNINNHALAQIAQIRSAGPMSLVGRVFAGEKGARVGAMFDSLVDVGTAHKARTQVRSGVANPSDVDYRTPIDNGIRRTAPPTAPSSEVRPVTQGVGHAPTQPAAAGGGGTGPSSTGPSSHGSGPGSSGVGSTGPSTGAPATPGPRTADTGSGPRTAATTGAGSGPAQARSANGDGGLPQSTYFTDSRRVTVVTATRGEQDMTLGDYRSRVEQARRWISQQGPYDLGGPPRHNYDRAAEIFTLDRNWQYLGNRLLNEW